VELIPLPVPWTQTFRLEYMICICDNKSLFVLKQKIMINLNSIDKSTLDRHCLIQVRNLIHGAGVPAISGSEKRDEV
jgi:hypothetical protein